MNVRLNSNRSLVITSRRPRQPLWSQFIVLLVAIGAVLGAQAQTAHFVGYLTQITTGFTLYAQYGNGGDAPAGVAFDPSGNLFVADPASDQVLKYTASAGGYLAPTVLASGFEAEYIAAGNDGTIYCAGQNGNAVAYVPNGNGYTPEPVQVVGTSGGPLSVGGIAVDSSGNVYLADRTDSKIIKYIFNSSAAGAYNRYTSQVIVGSGLHNLAGLAVYGTVVFATNGTTVLAFGPQNGGYTAPATIASGFSALSDLTATSTGTLYVADNGPIYKLTPSISGTFTKSLFASPGALYVTVDSGANVYTSVANDVNVEKFSPTFPSFGQVQANGGVSATQVAAFLFDTGGQAVPVFKTQGISNLDFQPTSPYVGTYPFPTGWELDVPIIFQPTVSGSRNGAVEVVNSSGGVLATLYLQGVGVGPQAALYPGLQSILFAGTSFHPQSVAVDAAGSVYVCDPTNNSVTKKTLQNGTYVSTTIGSSFNSPSGIALDGAGNIFISDAGNSQIVEEVLTGSTYQQRVIAGVGQPLGLTVNGAGVIYVADGSSGVYSETINASGTYIGKAVSSGASGPNGVAVDSNGNIYISDLGNKRILKETLNGNSTYTESTVFSGFTPSGVTLDSAGNVYVTDYDNGRIAIAMPNGTSYTNFNGATGLSTPGGLAVDQTGDLYIADSGNQRVLKANVAIGATLIFPDTAMGNSSAPQDITLANVGTSTLSVGIPATGSNPSLSSSFVLDNSTTCGEAFPTSSNPFTLQPNSNCTYAVDFSPTVGGPASGSLILSDNSTISSGDQQSVSLGGNGIAPTKTITFQQPTSPTMVGNSATLSATTSNGDPVTFAVTSGTAIISGTTVVYNTAGYVTITASSAASGNYAAATPVSVNVQVVPAQQTVSWQPSTLSIYTGTALGTGVLDATSNVAANITYASKLLPLGSTNMATASTVLSMGHYLLTATVTPTAAGYSAFSSSLPFYVQNMNPFIANANGSMSSLYNNGTAQSSSTTGGGIGAAVDSSGYVWSLSANGTSAVKYTDTGAVSATYSNIGLVAATALAVDGLGQVWIANGNNTVTALSNAGSVLSTTTNAYFSAPSGVAIDMSGNVWITSSANNTVEEVIGGAGPVAPLTNAVQNLSPATRP